MSLSLALYFMTDKSAYYKYVQKTMFKRGINVTLLCILLCMFIFAISVILLLLSRRRMSLSVILTKFSIPFGTDNDFPFPISPQAKATFRENGHHSKFMEVREEINRSLHLQQSKQEKVFKERARTTLA